MKKFFVFCLALMLALGCVSSSPRYTRTPGQMSQINSAVVALVRARSTGVWDSYCSGSFIGAETILTAAHCVRGSNIAYITPYVRDMGHYYENNNYTFYVTRVDEDADLALLRQFNNGQVLPRHSVLRVGQSAPTQGENVILVGHPYGLGWSLTAGVVSSDQRHGWDTTSYEDSALQRPLYIQHDAEADGGNSGGPLLNYQNQIVGVLVQILPQSQQLSMSVHTDVINAFLQGQEL